MARTKSTYEYCNLSGGAVSRSQQQRSQPAFLRHPPPRRPAGQARRPGGAAAGCCFSRAAARPPHPDPSSNVEPGVEALVPGEWLRQWWCGAATAGRGSTPPPPHLLVYARAACAWRLHATPPRPLHRRNSSAAARSPQQPQLPCNHGPVRSTCTRGTGSSSTTCNFTCAAPPPHLHTRIHFHHSLSRARAMVPGGAGECTAAAG
jgi:hypothetical protein